MAKLLKILLFSNTLNKKVKSNVLFTLKYLIFLSFLSILLRMH